MTIVFFKFSPKNKQIRHVLSKIPKSGIFDPKFSHFFFLPKLCYQTNSRLVISNATILFSNSSPKIFKSGLSGPKFSYICFFVKFCKQTNLSVLILKMTIVLLNILPKNIQIKHFCQKYSNKTFLVPNLGIFIILRYFAIIQIQGFWLQI